jgi:hypothetical protein
VLLDWLVLLLLWRLHWRLHWRRGRAARLLGSLRKRDRGFIK